MFQRPYLKGKIKPGSAPELKAFIFSLQCIFPKMYLTKSSVFCVTLRKLEQYLQIRNSFLKGLWVLSEQPLLLQELGVVAVRGGLEQTVVQDVPQRFGQGAQHLLLGLPHRGIRVEPQTFLQE